MYMLDAYVLISCDRRNLEAHFWLNKSIKTHSLALALPLKWNHPSMQEDTKIAQEILLDNWKIIGIFVIIEEPEEAPGSTEPLNRNEKPDDEWNDSDWALEDAEEFQAAYPSIPIYVFDEQGFLEEL